MNKINPFIQNDRIKVYKINSKSRIVDIEDIPKNNQINPNPNIKTLKTEAYLELDKSVNLYYSKDLRIVLLRLSDTANKILRYIECSIPYGSDIISINVEKFLNESLIKSRTSYYKGIEELIRYEFIAKSDKLNRFYINPFRLFKGCRSTTYPTHLQIVNTL
ncbi:MAG: hypothetical protein WC942_10995 [Clostridia bacterium]|jgi:hypothetical protein